MNNCKSNRGKDYCQEIMAQSIQQEIEEHISENRFFQQGGQESGLEMHDRSAFPIDEKGGSKQMPARTERSIGDQIRDSAAEVRQEDPRGQ